MNFFQMATMYGEPPKLKKGGLPASCIEYRPCMKFFTQLFGSEDHLLKKGNRRRKKVNKTPWTLTVFKDKSSGEWRSVINNPENMYQPQLYQGQGTKRRYKCTFTSCQFIKSTRAAVTAHSLQWHMDIPPFMCDICTFKTYNPDTWHRHQGSGCKDNFFRCELCNMTCNARSNLMKHKKNIHRLE